VASSFRIGARGRLAAPVGAGPSAQQRVAVALAVLVGLVVMVIAAVQSGASATPEAHSASPTHRPSPAIGGHAPAGHDLVASDVTAPEPTTIPLAPGLPVPSGQNESDPVVITDHGRYYLYTSGDPSQPIINVPVTSSSNFNQWGPVTDALPVLPGWAVPGFTWAPDVHRFGNHYVLYFTAIVKGTSPAMECIGSSTANSAVGPFTPSQRAFICQADQGGSIDPRVFTDDDGTNWMLFKSDQNIGGAPVPTRIWSQPLAADGLSLTGVPVDILGPDEPWQGTVVEAPDLVRVHGAYWLFYSANWFNQPQYAIGAARCTGPAGPCDEVSTTPLLSSNLQGLGPGEQSVFTSPSGVWMLYTPTKSLAPKPDARPVFITRIGFTAEAPYLASGAPPPALQP
jgi:hypothetical protein